MVFYDFHTLSYGGSTFSCPQLHRFVVLWSLLFFFYLFLRFKKISRYYGFRLDIQCFLWCYIILLDFQIFSKISTLLFFHAFRISHDCYISFGFLNFIWFSITSWDFQWFPYIFNDFEWILCFFNLSQILQINVNLGLAFHIPILVCWQWQP